MGVAWSRLGVSLAYLSHSLIMYVIYTLPMYLRTIHYWPHITCVTM